MPSADSRSGGGSGEGTGAASLEENRGGWSMEGSSRQGDPPDAALQPLLKRRAGKGPGGGKSRVERVHDRGGGVGHLPRASGPMGSEGGNQN